MLKIILVFPELELNISIVDDEAKEAISSIAHVADASMTAPTKVSLSKLLASLP